MRERDLDARLVERFLDQFWDGEPDIKPMLAFDKRPGGKVDGAVIQG